MFSDKFSLKTLNFTKDVWLINFFCNPRAVQLMTDIPFNSSLLTIAQIALGNQLFQRLNLVRIECFQMTSRRPCWCPKPILWEMNSFLMQTLSFVPINLHTCWPSEWKRSIKTVRAYANEDRKGNNNVSKDSPIWASQLSANEKLKVLQDSCVSEERFAYCTFIELKSLQIRRRWKSIYALFLINKAKRTITEYMLLYFLIFLHFIS